MRFRWVALTVVVLTGLLAAGLGIAISYEMDWLRVVTLIAVPVLGAGSIMVMKTRSQRKYRTDSPDSIEASVDREARSSAFVDTLTLVALLSGISTLLPGLPGWVLGFAVLAAMVLDYWLRSALVRGRERSRV